jgi:hypothetical protein
MSDKFDSAWLNARDMRISVKKQPDSGVNVCDEMEARESNLHKKIIDELNRRRWLFFHGSMAHKSKRTLGEPDFEIYGSGGRHWLVEAKTKEGKLSKDQLIVKMLAEMNGHEVHTIRSFDQFLILIGPNTVKQSS